MHSIFIGYMILQPFISEQFLAQIWKLIIDSDGGLLFVEVRDDKSRQVSFTAIDLVKGTTDFKDRALPEKWFSGLAGSYKGVLFLHGYQSAQSPAHKGITAIGKDGAELWVNYIDALYHISINGPVVYNTQVQPQKLFLVDTQTGKYIRPFNNIADLPPQQHITVPGLIDHIPTGFNLPGGELTGNIHYIEHNSFRIVSLHLLNGGILKQILLISKGGEIVYDDLLNGDIQKLQPESFILHRDKLIYIKNKTELKVLNL